ncbi:hypothetical protein B0H63DRAFT_507542 [Podospora didyma]|uniref:Uncharacterized protein n=1 Tax=Podospora didyma TaxID=330526 RepID=A0AAE0NZA8_9PEZI|nr:hypothetical protein B0H63DRAFT_507542 [Podospora didyma]
MQNAPEGTYGPHSTRVGNTLDPRVDSDNDHRNAPTGFTQSGTPGTQKVTENVGAGVNSSATAGENTGERVARNIKGTIAQGHGLTESLRGNIMSGVDSLVGDKTKQPRDEAIARAGDREFLNKEFAKKGTVHKNL